MIRDAVPRFAAVPCATRNTFEEKRMNLNTTGVEPSTAGPRPASGREVMAMDAVDVAVCCPSINRTSNLTERMSEHD
jgi:hypothetical protein